MEKWNLPKVAPPSWLDPANEVTKDSPKLPKGTFVVECMESLLRLGCDPKQAAGVTANSINESAWGQSYRANNLGGWKCTKAAAIAYALAHDGKGISWWQAPGNRAPGATVGDLRGGDSPWCYYRAFSSIGEFLGEWLKHFVPRPEGPAPYKGYKRCGELFWSHGDWFLELCLVGYKGANTKKNPEPSVREHESLVKASLVRWAQSRLPSGLVVDGEWGPKSQAACTTFQIAKRIKPTGKLDDATLKALAIS